MSDEKEEMILRLWKRGAGGQKVAHHIVIDKEQVILREGPPEVVNPAAPAPVAVAPAPHNELTDRLAKLGIGYRSENNQLIITHVPAAEQLALEFFVEGRPCPFPDCEPLRAAYQKELQSLEAGDCTDCEKGVLIRKYREIIEPFLQAAAAA